jgi:hypothetical protein
MSLVSTVRKKLYRPIYTTLTKTGEINLQTFATTETSQTGYAGSASFNNVVTTPDGSYIIKADFTNSIIYFYNITTPAQANALSWSSVASPYNIAVSPDGLSLAVFGQTQFQILNLSRLYLSTPLAPTQSQIFSVANTSGAFTPDGTKLVMTSNGTNQVRVYSYSGTTWAAAGNVTTSTAVNGICCDNTSAYASSSNSVSIFVCNLSSFTVTSTLTATGTTGRGVSITSDKKNLIVARLASGIDIINIATNTKTNLVPTGLVSAYSTATSPKGDYAAVNDGGTSGKIYLIDLSNNSLKTTVSSASGGVGAVAWLVR